MLLQVCYYRQLVLTSLSGANIMPNDGTATGFITAVTDINGVNYNSSQPRVYYLRGLITLTSNDGSIISIEDGEQAHTPAWPSLGLQAQSEASRYYFRLACQCWIGGKCNCGSELLLTLLSIRFQPSALDLVQYENRLDSAISNLTTYQTNLDASRGRIVDADFASETSKLTKAQILQQAATSMLAQANASKQGLLALLQG